MSIARIELGSSGMTLTLSLMTVRLLVRFGVPWDVADPEWGVAVAVVGGMLMGAVVDMGTSSTLCYIASSESLCISSH